MLPQMLAKSAETPPARLFWAVILTLVLAQIIAFWTLCSHQVRKAEVRDATLQVERMAVADCLRYIPRATLNSCAARLAPQVHEAGPVPAAGTGAPAVSTAKPVSVAFR